MYSRLFRTPRPTLLITALLISACSGQEGDWIDVPLADHTYYESERSYQESEYEILVLNQSAREFKLALNEGDSIVYEWSVEMDKPELLTAEFHGHTDRVGEEPGTVMFYKIHTDGREQGALVAPFDGIHGWYLKNDSDQDIHIKLRVAGYHEEVE
ncbi:hypothetical protein ACXYTJ_14880 [Gilvimarinus sp. F26214L]|uniref:hypothetical protein n=1 Tax=Gilvimarinus sp. DZF01 TaxID=3461371 RepID=UPI00404547DB